MTENEPGNVFAFANRDAGRHLPKPSAPDERPRWVGRAAWAGAGTAVVLLIGGGAVYGAAQYARGNVCASIQGIRANATGMTSGDSLVIPDSALAATGQKLSDQAQLLILDRDLENAVQRLSVDTVRLQEVGDAGTGPTSMPQLMILFQSVDEHFKQAQQACGQTADGLLATGLGGAVLTGANNAATGLTPAPAVTPTPVPAPAYTASPGELTAARNDLAARRDDLTDLRAGGSASAADRAVATYEVAAAKQRLADLEAGRPGDFHQALELRGATAYLARARESLRQVRADASAVDADRANARADVTKWQRRVTELS
ncbi:hypothetical protein [Actinoplanes sp. L3-i22]|uniref:hypothetical protein n=1 Tax=Actinoplanes sp. L3-i22 TaxID=2836373 RepID=UPI001C774A9A|nr:hypothetical protein [Actinoplanes sp. L3-i22]BCY08031.1 hypothetical protein L3i22_031190 [Actinoplanes sp. L3-i22]